MKPKGVLVKKVSPTYKMTDEEAELIAALTEKGHILILGIINK